MTACKRCGKPANLYSKWSLCDDCGSAKQRWENRMAIFIMLSMISLSLFIYSSLGLFYHQEIPLRTIYWASVSLISTGCVGYCRRKTQFK